MFAECQIAVAASRLKVEMYPRMRQKAFAPPHCEPGAGQLDETMKYPTVRGEAEGEASTMGRNVVQGLWIGQSLSIMEKLPINSYIEHGHKCHLYIYNDVAGIPPKTRLMDANEILPSSAIFQYQNHKSSVLR